MTQDRGTHDMRDGTRASVKQKGGEESPRSCSLWFGSGETTQSAGFKWVVSPLCSIRHKSPCGQSHPTCAVSLCWNSLPATLRNVPLPRFKFHLKTFLFAQAFQQNLCLKKGLFSEWRWRHMGGGGGGGMGGESMRAVKEY